MGLDWELIQSLPAVGEPQHPTRRGFPVLERFPRWMNKEEARPVRKLSCQPSGGGRAQLGGAPALQQRRHPKDVARAVVS